MFIKYVINFVNDKDCICLLHQICYNPCKTWVVCRGEYTMYKIDHLISNIISPPNTPTHNPKRTHTPIYIYAYIQGQGLLHPQHTYIHRKCVCECVCDRTLRWIVGIERIWIFIVYSWIVKRRRNIVGMYKIYRNLERDGILLKPWKKAIKALLSVWERDRIKRDRYEWEREGY